MTLVAGTLIDEARDMHVSFDARHHPPKALLRELDRYQVDLLSRLLQINEDYLSSTLSTLLPLAVFADGIGISADHIPTRAEAIDTHGDAHDLTLLPWAYRQDPAPRIAGYVNSSRLYLRGEAAGWTHFTRIDLFLQPRPTALTAFTGTGSALTIRDGARDALVTRVARFMAFRGHTEVGTPSPNTREFDALWREAEARVVQEVANMRSGETFSVREVW